jgi:hypothetical protein
LRFLSEFRLLYTAIRVAFGTFGLLTAVVGRQGESALSLEYLRIENHSPQIMLEARNTEYNKESLLRVRENVTQRVWGNMEMFCSFSLLEIRFPTYTSVYVMPWL